MNIPAFLNKLAELYDFITYGSRLVINRRSFFFPCPPAALFLLEVAFSVVGSHLGNTRMGSLSPPYSPDIAPV